MVQSVCALVLFTSRAEEMVGFYRALGVELGVEQHDDGPVHWAGEVGEVHFAVFQAEGPDAPGYGTGGATFPGFVVESLDDSLRAAQQAGAPVIQQPIVMPWGRRAVVSDPDGRPVELVERPPEASAVR